MNRHSDMTSAAAMPCAEYISFPLGLSLQGKSKQEADG